MVVKFKRLRLKLFCRVEFAGFVEDCDEAHDVTNKDCLVRASRCCFIPACFRMLHTLFKIALRNLKTHGGVAQVLSGQHVFSSSDDSFIGQVVNRRRKSLIHFVDFLEQRNRSGRFFQSVIDRFNIME